jgi:hypothetical protein
MSIKYSRSVTGTPADFSSWKKVTNMIAAPRQEFAAARPQSSH